MRADLPSGTVTFLFTDVEGSTRLLDKLGAGAYAKALADHRRLLRAAFAGHGGVEVDTQGDAFFVAFPTADGAAAAALEAQAALADGPIRVRMGIHTGTPLLTAEGYVGPDVHRAARIAAAGHGGQVLLSSASAGLVPDRRLHDLGEHRLKDLSAPVRIYQMGAGEFPPLRTLYQTNLPVPTTSFLGRDRELAELAALLGRDDVRLITLTGPGGTGKTRLALQAAGAAAERFPDGVWWVSLAPLRDPALVLPVAAAALAASGELADHIGNRRLLLLFDNFEHLVEAASEVGGLLGRCPNLRALVTSRELLQLPGEHVYAVPPLEPEQGHELFVTRARAVTPDFAGDGTVDELCARLDNLPLALELAAARVRMLSPEQLLQRLGQRLDLLKGGRGVDDRQQTLRATIEWSHDLLDDGEQRLFARLAVFRGGWTLEAGEQICDADLDVLQSLVDKSLVRIRDDRFWMLETIREFAAERLEASRDAAELRRRHAEHFLRLAEVAARYVSGGAKEWLDRLEAEHDNLRAAFDSLLADEDAAAAQRLVGLLYDFWMVHGHFVEGSRRAEAALAADVRSTPARAAALHTAAHFADIIGQRELARLRGTEALHLNTQLGDARGIALARHFMGGLAAADDDWVAARDMWLECLEAFARLGDEHWTLVARRGVAHASAQLGDMERYRQLTQENLEHARRVGDRRIEARALGALAIETLHEGQLDFALEQLMASYSIDRELANPMFIAVDLVRFAAILLARGQAQAAARLVARSDRLWAELGASPEPWMAEERSQTVELIRRQLDDAAFAEASRQAAVLGPDEAIELALGEAVQEDAGRQ